MRCRSNRVYNKELVPCVLLSFDDEQILMWRGREWKSMYPDSSAFLLTSDATIHGFDDSGKSGEAKTVSSSPRMISLWKHAIESNKAALLDETDLGPDALLERVEEFERLTQATEHSYPALVHSGGDRVSNSEAEESVFKDDEDFDDYSIEEEDDEFQDYGDDDDDLFEKAESPGPLGSLPVDVITTGLLKHND